MLSKQNNAKITCSEATHSRRKGSKRYEDVFFVAQIYQALLVTPAIESVAVIYHNVSSECIESDLLEEKNSVDMFIWSCDQEVFLWSLFI